MANQQSLSGLSKFGDLKKRLVFLLGALAVFRIGAHIPVPDVDVIALARLYEGVTNGIFGMLNMFSDGSLRRFSIFAIGIMPYISSSIIIQLASEIIPSLKALKKESKAGRKIITKYTRYGTVLLTVLQNFGVATFVYQQGVAVTSSLKFHISIVVCLVTGTMFLMWLGEQITKRGVDNGISLIITAGIISDIPSGIIRLLTLAEQGPMSMLVAISIVVDILPLAYAVVCSESAQRKAPVYYAKRQFGSGMTSGQSIHMPFKLNMAGVIPPIFASSIIFFPSTLLGWSGSDGTNSILHRVTAMLQHGQPSYIVLFTTAIIFFYYFYTALVLGPKEMAENLRKSGTFVLGIYPGGQTSRYLEKVVLRLILFGALYITTICLIPEFLMIALNVSFYLGGASLLILVVVTMNFRTQINPYAVSSQHEDLMNHPDMKSLSCK